jgi:hypothetical protein
MYKIVISGLSPLALLLLTTLSTPAAAEASVEAVVAACARMADQNPGSCDYKIEGNELRGCTKTCASVVRPTVGGFVSQFHNPGLLETLK